MKPIFQPKGEKVGSCLTCCVASIFEKERLDVPLFLDMDNDGKIDYNWWWPAMDSYCRKELKAYPTKSFKEPKTNEYYIIVTRVKRNKMHAVVGHKGKEIHNPNTSDSGKTIKRLYYILFHKL